MGESRIIRILCILLFIYELSALLHTGIRNMFPVYAYGGRGETAIWEDIAAKQAAFLLPVFAYPEKEPVKENRKDIFPIKTLEEKEMLTLMELENSSLGHAVSEQTALAEQEMGEKLEGQKETDESVIQESQKLPEQTQENEQAVSEQGEEVPQSGFVKHEKVAPVDLQELADYETLVKRFYTIDAITAIGPEELNAEAMASIDVTMKQTADAPQILIYHTHSQEGFADSVPGEDATTIMGVGEHLKEILEQEYGYNVLHHLGKYDVASRDNAYSKSLPEIRQLLEDNPTIEVVIDLHRDAVADENTRLVMDLDGRPTAKFMFFNGISRTKSTGKIDYLYNENLETNLAFSFQMKWKAEEYYPGLTRRNYINAYRYNMHLCPKTLLLELGAQNNTLEEVMNACDPIAHILHIVLSGE